jgi:hypothetical protein
LTSSILKTIPLRVIPKIPPLRVMPQRRPPRVISQRTPLRVVGVGENCRQGVRRAEDLHVARCMTGRSRKEAGLLTRRRRSTRCGGDRHRSNRGCKQRYVVVQPRSHDHVPFDMLGMIPARRPSSCLARHTGAPGHRWIHPLLTFRGSLSRRRVDVGPGVVAVSARIPQVCRRFRLCDAGVIPGPGGHAKWSGVGLYGE